MTLTPHKSKLHCTVTLKGRTIRTCGRETELRGRSLLDMARPFAICTACIGRVKRYGSHVSPTTLGLLEVWNHNTGEEVKLR